MARKTAVFVVQDENRDQGKTFLITEMPPRRAEKWAGRALNAIAKSGHNEMPADFTALGMAGFAQIGVRALTTMDFDDAEPLLDEMLGCVQFIPDASKINQFNGMPFALPLSEETVEEVMTLLQLRSEVIELHTGFSVIAYLSMLGQAMKQGENT